MSGALNVLLWIVGLLVGVVLLASVFVRQVRELVLHPIEAWHVALFVLFGNKKQVAPPGSSPELVYDRAQKQFDFFFIIIY